MREKDILTSEDLIRIGHYIYDSIPYDREDPDEGRKREYIRILERMADTMQDGDIVTVTDKGFHFQHEEDTTHVKKYVVREYFKGDPTPKNFYYDTYEEAEQCKKDLYKDQYDDEADYIDKIKISWT